MTRWSRCLGYQMTCCVTVMLCYLINLINTINWWGLGRCHDLSCTQYHVSLMCLLFKLTLLCFEFASLTLTVECGPLLSLFSDGQSSDWVFRTSMTNHNSFLLTYSEFSATTRYHVGYVSYKFSGWAC